MSTPGDTSATFCATLVDEWIRQGVKHAVVAPGSRSTPLAVALSARSEISLHIFHDERSASFAALGIGLETGVPAVLLCTSGTAAAHFHGAVAEADLSNVPMIVCTADRPPELRDVGAPQTIDQTNLFGSMVRWFHDPGVPSDDARHSWRSLASRLVAASVANRPGPVHVNLPFREPLLGKVGELPEARDGAWSRTITHFVTSEEQIDEVAELVSGKSGVIVAGRNSSSDVLKLAERLNWPVLADARSDVRVQHSHVVLHSDAILRSSSLAEKVRPEFIIRIGEPPASKVTNQWIAASGAVVVQVQPHGNVTDPDHLVRIHLLGSVASNVRSLSAKVNATKSNSIALWLAAEQATQETISHWCQKNESEISNAREVTKSLLPGDRLVVSSSMPIRDIEWFGSVTPDVVVHSNRGANGIDGVTSTAVGVALVSKKKTVLYIGDVAAIHDANGLLGLAQRDAEVKVVVSNNDGGSIFSFLPQATQVDAQTFETLYGTPHGVSFEALAAAYGIPYQYVENANALGEAIKDSGTCLIEVRTNRSVNVAQHNELNALIVEAIEKNLR